MVEKNSKVDGEDTTGAAIESFVDFIREADCVDFYRDCLKCKYISGDWKDCIRQVTALKKCFRSYWIKQKEEEEFLKTIDALLLAPSLVQRIITSTMLSDVFGNLSIVDECDEKAEVSVSDVKNPSKYSALDNSKCWFLKLQQGNSDREILRLTADYKYFKKEFNAALEYYQKFLDSGEHKESFKFSILDSIVRSGLKDGSMSPEFLANLLCNCCLPLIKNFGEQLQFWDLSIKVYAEQKKFAREYFITAVLLCNTLDTTESWEQLAVASVGDTFENFRLGCLVRGLCIAQEQIQVSHGFIRKRICSKALNLKRTLESSYSELAVETAKNHLCEDLQNGGFRSLVDICEQPVYNCHSLEMLKTIEEQHSIIVNFIVKFSWLFGDKINDVISLVSL